MNVPKSSRWTRQLRKSLLKPSVKTPPTAAPRRWRILTGDTVEVISGPDVGRQGVVQAVYRDAMKVVVSGVNLHHRVNSSKPPVAKPLHYSNVMLVDPSTGKPSKVGFTRLESGETVRVLKSTGAVLQRPDPFKDRKPKTFVAGPFDTAADDALEVTFPDYERFLPLIYNNSKA